MNARTSSYETSRKDWIMQAIPMAENETIYKSSTVMINSNGLAFTNDGTTNTLNAWDIFAWMCVEETTSTIAWQTYVNVYREWSFLLNFTDTLTQANLWAKVYVNNTSDDGAVTITADGGVDVHIWNIVEYVSNNSAYVNITWKAWFEIAA